jgi:tRNA A-37 threonylcarbamoyl transferase component Bud32
MPARWGWLLPRGESERGDADNDSAAVRAADGVRGGIGSLEQLISVPVSPELQRLDAVLGDEALRELVVERLARRRPLSRTQGRPGTPAEVVLRMLVLRRWGAARGRGERARTQLQQGYRHLLRIVRAVVRDSERIIHELTEGLRRAVDERAAHVVIAVVLAEEPNQLLSHLRRIGIHAFGTFGCQLGDAIGDRGKHDRSAVSMVNSFRCRGQCCAFRRSSGCLDPSRSFVRVSRQTEACVVRTAQPSCLPTPSSVNECGQAARWSGDSVSVSDAAAPTPVAIAAGRYRVQRLLGEGARKRVYLARDTRLERDIALALIKTDGLDEAGRLRVQREAQAMADLGDHAHIVTVYDIGEDDGQIFIVSQYMAGGSVEDLAQGLRSGVQGRGGDRVGAHGCAPLPVTDVLRIGDQICQALDHAHRRGVVHRDLKPANVWLTADGTAKLGDFGLALSLAESRLTQAGMMVGTVAYMAPEQAVGGAVTAQADLYSLGVVLYEMLAGRPPFLGDDPVAVIGQHLQAAPVAPSHHNSAVPVELDELILRLLAKAPEERPANAAAVRTALALCVRVESVAADADAPTASTPALDALAGGVFVGRGRSQVIAASLRANEVLGVRDGEVLDGNGTRVGLWTERGRGSRSRAAGTRRRDACGGGGGSRLLREDRATAAPVHRWVQIASAPPCAAAAVVSGARRDFARTAREGLQSRHCGAARPRAVHRVTGHRGQWRETPLSGLARR